MPVTAGTVRVEWLHEREGHTARTLAPFTFGDDERVYTVPIHFATDFASVPRVLWRVAGPLDAIEASVAHDWLYATGKTDRKTADEWFYRLMRARTIHPLPLWRAKVMYRGVRLGGWAAWNQHRQRAL